MYRAPELDIDAFGVAAASQQTLSHITGERINHQTRLGAGAGVSFFALRMLGIGAEAYSFDTRHNFIDDLSGNLILRLPVLDTGFAPYIFGGGGHKFDRVEGNFAQGGGGLEFRFHPNFAFFVDGRFVFAHHVDDYGLGRAGFRFAL